MFNINKIKPIEIILFFVLIICSIISYFSGILSYYGIIFFIILLIIGLIISIYYLIQSIKNKNFHIYVFSVIIIALFYIIGLKNIEKPGEGNTAIYGLKIMYILQDEIYKYKIEYNDFPEDLKFLKELKLSFEYELNEMNNSIKLIHNKSCYIRYEKNNDNFQLEYVYGPPGRNIMIYDNKNKNWIIYGYY